MKPLPEDVKLSREDGEALIARVQAKALTGEDRRLLVRLIRVYFGLTFALSETRISLTQLKRAFQALVGAPVADAAQWELAKQVADCASIGAKQHQHRSQ